MPITILLADKNKTVRKVLRILLDSDKDLEVIGEAGNGQSVVQMAQALSPDVVLMDVNFQDLSGMEATEQILAESPGQKVVILSLQKNQGFVDRALQAGAKGYLLKDCAFHELARAIHAVARGGTYLSADIQGNGPGSAER
ncbi:MAG: response regulator transcription factor [bacterium]